MTTYTITTKTDIQSTVTPTLNVETNIFNYTAQAADYVFEGYIDFINMASGDTTVVTEYISVDGTNLHIYQQNTLTNAQTQPVARFHGKLFELNMLYRVTIKQTGGTARAYPYSGILQVFNA